MCRAVSCLILPETMASSRSGVFADMNLGSAVRGMRCPQRVSRRALIGLGLCAGLLPRVSTVLAATLSLSVEDAVLVLAPELGGLRLQVTLTPESRLAFRRFTAARVGGSVEFSLGGTVLSRPKIMSPIEGGTLLLGGEVSADELRHIADGLSPRDMTISVRDAAEPYQRR